MKHIRLATEEEVKRIRKDADLHPSSSVLALDGPNGEADLAVLRNCWEVDPVVYAEGTNDLRRAKFLWGLEERLIGAGIDRYYFQIAAEQEQYIKTVQHWGAEQVSAVPELRFLKVIK